MSHVTHMNESCHTYEWVMSHIWMGHVTHMNESCHTYAWVMSHIRMHHVTHMNKSCYTYECVMSHIWMSHVTYMNASCHTYEWVMSHIRITVLNVLAQNPRNWSYKFPPPGLKVAKARFQRFLEAKMCYLNRQIREFHANWMEIEVLERYCGWQNKATLLKPTLENGPCIHAAGALQLNAWKSYKVSTINTRKFD